MSVLIKGLNIEPCDDGFGGRGLVIIGYDDKLYAVAHEQIVPLPDDATIEPKKGKWLLHEYPDGYYHTECSECGKVYSENVYFLRKPNYCPNCGARMESDDEA